MTTRPKRAWLSLKSLLVMCVVMAVFVWANVRDRFYDITDTDADIPHVFPKDGPRTYIWRFCYRGFPWTYYVEGREHLVLDGSGDEISAFGPEWYGPVESVTTGPLLLNLAVALLVSVSLALASERFVFSRMRRRREEENAGERRPLTPLGVCASLSPQL